MIRVGVYIYIVELEDNVHVQYSIAATEIVIVCWTIGLESQ